MTAVAVGDRLMAPGDASRIAARSSSLKPITLFCIMSKARKCLELSGCPLEVVNSELRTGAVFLVVVVTGFVTAFRLTFAMLITDRNPFSSR